MTDASESLRARKTALLDVLNTCLKLMRRRPDARGLAKPFTRLRDEILEHDGPPGELTRYTCDAIVRLVAKNGPQHPMSAYARHAARFETAMRVFASAHPEAGAPDWRAFIIDLVKKEKRPALPTRDVDEILHASKVEIKARRLVFHLFADPEDGWDEFSRSLRRASQTQ